jgi:hypothetical protein
MYSTYDDARARERELLQLAQKNKIGSSGPPRDRSSLVRPKLSRFLAALRYAAGHRPAIERAD